MPNQHRRQPMSIRVPDHLQSWIIGYAELEARTVSSVIVEALEEYRLRREPTSKEKPLHTVAVESAKQYLRHAFTFKFLNPNEMLNAPISFPGMQRNSDGTLPEAVKARATEYL